MQSQGQAPPNKGQDLAGQLLTADEVLAIIGQCSMRAPTGIRNRAMLALMYRSGLRVTEALDVQETYLSTAEHSVRLMRTKSGKPQTRGYHPSADDALARWIDTRRELGLRNGRCKCPPRPKNDQTFTPEELARRRALIASCTAHLFCTLAGTPVSDRYVRDMMKRNAARAGVTRRVHPHALRHTFAVELLHTDPPTPIPVISKLLGHSSIAITARYLDHLTNGEAVTALQGARLSAL